MLPTGFQADPSKVERGRRKFSEANCTYCHRGNTMGISEIRALPTGLHIRREALLAFKYEKKQPTQHDSGGQASPGRRLEDIAEFAASAVR